MSFSLLFSSVIFISFTVLWISCILYFYLPRFVPLFRDVIKLSDTDLNKLSNFILGYTLLMFLAILVLFKVFKGLESIVLSLFVFISLVSFYLIRSFVKRHAID